MKPGLFNHLIILVIFSMIMLFCGLYLLANFGRLFRRAIRNELLRENLVVWMISICLILSVAPTTPDFYAALSQKKMASYYAVDCFGVTLEALFVFNIAWLVIRVLENRVKSFKKRMAIVLATIVICTVIMSAPLNYLGNMYLGTGPSFKNLDFTILYNFYTGCMTGLIYITMNFVNLDRKRKLSEKELEVSKLQALKTKAELDALHSKINPHFLYNALNSIADLSITDGKKARKMTIALADLFRYSINYRDNNYSTVEEELEMTEVYLAIEKIRFEDKLTYSIQLGKDVNHYLVPRFLLQPIVENAVKHGLKATGELTEIAILVDTDGEKLDISVSDNGPAFPAEIMPGYGIKSMYDKLDLLFPGCYEIHFSNEPAKKLTITISKLIKNEPVV